MCKYYSAWLCVTRYMWRLEDDVLNQFYIFTFFESEPFFPFYRVLSSSLVGYRILSNFPVSVKMLELQKFHYIWIFLNEISKDQTQVIQLKHQELLPAEQHHWSVFFLYSPQFEEMCYIQWHGWTVDICLIYSK